MKAELCAHDVMVMKRVANGQIAVKPHQSQNKKFCGAKEKKEIHLGDATIKGDDHVSRDEIREHSGYSNCGVTYLKKREIIQEKIHRSS